MGEFSQVSIHDGAAPPAGVVIERMRVQHLSDVLRIEQESYSMPWSREGFLKELEAAPLSFAIVAQRGGAVLGYVVAWFILEEAHIGNVVVAREARRQGIGRLMMEWLLDRAVAQGCTFATLEVRESNFAARRLYDTLWFKAVGRRRTYYTKPIEDAIVMVRALE